MRLQKAESIRWHSDFHDLPPAQRACRHELTGEVKERKCPNAFDCRVCETHSKLLARRPATASLAPLEPEIFGMPFPADLIGKPDNVELPAAGVRIHANGTAWRASRRGADVRVLSPVDGEVVETGGPDREWYLRVKPVGGDVDTRHLLCPGEVKPWMMRELERLQIAVGAGAVGASLADGGVPVDDIAAAYPEANWDAVCGAMFLEP
jgi:hypothetical protein